VEFNSTFFCSLKEGLETHLYNFSYLYAMKTYKIIRQILNDYGLDLDQDDEVMFQIELNKLSPNDKEVISKAFKDYHDLLIKEAFGEFLHLDFKIYLN